MRKIEFSIGALLLGCAVAACSGGGGSSLPTAPQQGGSHAQHTNVAFTITIPPAGASAAARTPKYVSASTQSVSIVETDAGAAPLPAVVQNTTPGSPNCTTSNGSTSCTISVSANVGDDSFTVKTFEKAGAAGNLLSEGTVKGTVVSGTANSFPLTLSGTVASFTLNASEAYPKIGGTTTITAQAKDAGGNTIIGTYDAPIALTTTGSATLDAANITSSSDARTLTLSNSQTASFAVNGSINGKTGSLTINPSSGIVYYNVGSGALDATGFNIITGNDGKMYYTALGLLSCNTSGFCVGNSGVVGQFDPANGSYTEIPFNNDEPVAPFQTADGTIWVSLASTTTTGTGPVVNGYVGRISGGFSAANLSTIALPTPAPFNNASRPRSFALGADGNLYLTGNSDNNIYQIPTSNPSTSTITAIKLPVYSPPPNAPWPYSQRAQAQGITTGPDGNLYIANHSGNAPNVLQYAWAGNVFTPFALPGPAQAQAPRYIVTGSDGNLYETSSGTCAVMPCGGGLNALTTAGVFTPIALPDGFSQPDDIAAGNGFVAFADLGQGALGTYDFSSKELRDYPIEPINGEVQCCTVWSAPDGVTVGSDGSLWYITDGQVSKGGPLAIAHVVMTNNWSIWPSQKIDVFGTGTLSAQLVGIMESGNSGPFSVVSSDEGVAQLVPIAGESHDFHVVGFGPGSCTLTITDKNGRSESIAVTVTTTNGTVQLRRTAIAGASHGGLL